MANRRRFLQWVGAGSFFPLHAALAGTAAGAGENDGTAPAVGFRRAAGRTVLLVDDHDVLYRSGTRRVLRPLTRHPANPLVLGRERPWETAVAFCSVHHDAARGRYQMWYQSYAGPAARDKTRSCVVCYAESADGVKWEKPDLGLFPFNGERRTNICLIANGGQADRYGAAVVHDPRDADPARRYKMAHFDFCVGAGGKEYPGLTVAFSPDGIRWTKYPGGNGGPLQRVSYGNLGDPVPFSDEEAGKPYHVPLAMADAFDACYDPAAGRWLLYGKMWIDGPDGTMFWKHALGRTESKDFVNWSAPQLVMTPDDLDPPRVEFHATPVFVHHGVYFAAPQILDRAEGNGVVDVELATSRDGVLWERPFRKPYWLPRGEPGRFDGGSLFTNATPVTVGDEMRFYYGGYANGATGADASYPASGIGLATMRRDRFAGVRPTETVGQITMKPLDLRGVKRITLNADAAAGDVRVELLDARGRRVRGYAKEDAVPVQGDGLAHAVAWNGRTPAELPPGGYVLRLHLRAAEVFAASFVA